MPIAVMHIPEIVLLPPDDPSPGDLMALEDGTAKITELIEVFAEMDMVSECRGAVGGGGANTYADVGVDVVFTDNSD